jgi:hypothetical protein
VRDELLEQDTHAAEDASAIAKVRTVLLERDEVLRKAREDMVAVGVAAAEFESELASAQLKSSKTAPPSRGRGPSRARPRRRPRRPSS